MPANRMAGSTAGDRAWQPALGFSTSLLRSLVQGESERRGVRAVYDRIILRVWEGLPLQLWRLLGTHMFNVR